MRPSRRELAQAGAHVVVQDLRIEGAEETVAAIQAAGGSAQASEGDVTQPDQIRRTVEETIAARDRIDILVNNAGLQYVAPIDEYPLEKWNQLLAVLLTGPFLFTQAVLPAMRAQTVGPDHQHRLDQRQARRCRQGGLLRRQARRDRADADRGPGNGEGRHHGQRDLPRSGDTPLIQGQLDDLARVHRMAPDEVLQRHFLANIPTGRATEPAEIASLARYLASDEARSITGQAINVSAGLIMH